MLQGRFIGFPRCAGDAGDRLLRQSCCCQGLGNGLLHQRNTGVALTADADPERCWMPLAITLTARSDHEISGVCPPLGIDVVQQGMAFRASPGGGSTALVNADAGSLGLPHHQIAPMGHRSAAFPAPALAKGIQGETSFMGAGARDHRLPAEIHGDFPGALFGPCGMASQQRNDEFSFRVKHQNGWILLLALDPSCNQARHCSHGAHEQHDVLCRPVPIKGDADVLIGWLDPVDVAAQQQTLQQRHGAGAQS